MRVPTTNREIKSTFQHKCEFPPKIYFQREEVIAMSESGEKEQEQEQQVEEQVGAFFLLPAAFFFSSLPLLMGYLVIA
jgi:hypothetical protein